MEKRYYLAYGSNLNVRQMKARCPGAKPVGTSEIPGYELLFKGSKTGSYLTIEKKKGSFVPVTVWSVTQRDERNLDIYEGYPNFYYKKEIEVKLNSNRKIKSFVYIMHENRQIGIPTKGYIDTCLEGYENFGFDYEPLIKAYEKSVEVCLNEN